MGNVNMPREKEFIQGDARWKTDSPLIPSEHWLAKLTTMELLSTLQMFGIKISYTKINSRADLQETFLKASFQSKHLKRLISKTDLDISKSGFRGINTQREDTKDAQAEEIPFTDIVSEENKDMEKVDFFSKDGSSTLSLSDPNISDCLTLIHETIYGIKRVLESQAPSNDGESSAMTQVSQQIGEQLGKLTSLINTVQKVTEKAASQENFQLINTSAPTLQMEPYHPQGTQIQVEGLSVRPTEFWAQPKNDIHDWLRIYEFEARGWGWDDETKCRKIFLALKGDAALKYEAMWGLGESEISWVKQKNMLIDTFKENRMTLQEKLLSMTSLDEDALEDHVADMMRVAKKINSYINEEELLLRIIQSIPEEARKYPFQLKPSAIPALKGRAEPTNLNEVKDLLNEILMAVKNMDETEKKCENPKEDERPSKSCNQ